MKTTSVPKGIYVSWTLGPGEKPREGIPQAGQLTQESEVVFACRCDSFSVSRAPKGGGLKYRIHQRWAMGQWGTAEHWEHVTSRPSFKEACAFALRAVRRAAGDIP